MPESEKPLFTQAQMDASISNWLREFRHGTRPGRPPEYYRRWGDQWSEDARRAESADRRLTLMEMAEAAWQAEADARQT